MAAEKTIAIFNYDQGIKKSVKEFTKNIQTSKMPLSFDNEKSYALMAIKGNNTLQKCSVASVQDCIEKVGLTGLSLNPSLGHSWMVPRYVKNIGWTACLDIGYQGWILMAYETGYVTNIEAHVVYQCEVDAGSFDIDLGRDQKITHRPWYMLGVAEDKRGAIFGAYARITLKGGAVKEEFMPVSEIHKIRNVSKSYQTSVEKKYQSIWTGPFKERMYQKTVIISALKYVPSANLSKRAETALALEYDDKDLQTQEKQENAKARGRSAVKGAEQAMVQTQNIDHEELWTLNKRSKEYVDLTKFKNEEIKAKVALIVDIDKMPVKKVKDDYLSILVSHAQGKLEDYLEVVFQGKGDWLKVCAPKPIPPAVKDFENPIDLRLHKFTDLNEEKKTRGLKDVKALMELLESIGIENFKANMKDTDYPWETLEHLCKEGTLHEITEIINFYNA